MNLLSCPYNKSIFSVIESCSSSDTSNKIFQVTVTPVFLHLFHSGVCWLIFNWLSGKYFGHLPVLWCISPLWLISSYWHDYTWNWEKLSTINSQAAVSQLQLTTASSAVILLKSPPLAAWSDSQMLLIIPTSYSAIQHLIMLFSYLKSFNGPLWLT